MASIKELLEIRKQLKNKKPEFVRQDINKKKRLKRRWRKPKGVHSKIWSRLRGRAKRVSRGYRSPKKVRYLHKSGLQQIVIKSLKDLERINAKKAIVVLSSSLGNKKRVGILKKAKEMGFSVLNIKNPEEYIKKVEDRIRLNKEKKKEVAEKAKEEKKEVKKEKEEKKLMDKVSEEEKKEMEKKEKDKILTKKEK